MSCNTMKASAKQTIVNFINLPGSPTVDEVSQGTSTNYIDKLKNWSAPYHLRRNTPSFSYREYVNFLT